MHPYDDNVIDEDGLGYLIQVALCFALLIITPLILIDAGNYLLSQMFITYHPVNHSFSNFIAVYVMVLFMSITAFSFSKL